MSRNEVPLFLRPESCRQTLLSSNLTSRGRLLDGLETAGGGGRTGTITGTGIKASGVGGTALIGGVRTGAVNGDVTGK